MGGFGDLLAKAGLQASPEAEAEATSPEPAAPDAPRFAPKVVLRRTRKGRGGRTVTLIQGIEAGHDVLLGRVKKHLGVGARREEDELVVQGDQVDRLAAWLEGLDGVRKVVRS
jgi:translation initiation factor 1